MSKLTSFTFQVTCIVLSFQLTAFAQWPPPDTLWTVIDEYPHMFSTHRCVIQATDSDIVIAGQHEHSLSIDKFNINGNPIWNTTFDGSWYDRGKAILETDEGGFVVLGTTTHYGDGGYNVWLVKVDANGDSLWSRTYGDPVLEERGHSIDYTSDGGYIISGATNIQSPDNADVWLIKVDSEGNEEWSRSYGGPEDERGLCVLQTLDGGYIIAGTTEDAGWRTYAIWLVRTDSVGDTLWTRKHGGSTETSANCLRNTTDGGYIITGLTGGAGEYTWLYLLKLDDAFNVEWSKMHGGGLFNVGNWVEQTADGGYIAVGDGLYFDVNYTIPMYALKTDANGDSLWNRSILHGWDGRAEGVCELSGGGYVLVGRTDVEYEGNCRAIVCLDSEGEQVSAFDTEPATFDLVRAYPNPFNPTTTIEYSLVNPGDVTLSVYNISGQRVDVIHEGYASAGHHSATWSPKDMSSGIYFVELKAGADRDVVKVMYVK